MERGRHVPHDLIADEARQHEHREVAEKGRRREDADQDEEQRRRAEDHRRRARRHRLTAAVSVALALGSRLHGRLLRRRPRRRGGQLRGRRRPGDHALLDHGRAADDLVLHVDAVLAVLRLAQFLGQAEQVGRVEIARLARQAAGQIGVSDDGDAVPDHDLARFGQFAVAALLRRHVDDHAARLHRLHHLGGDELRGRLSRNQGGRDDDVDLLGLLREHFALRLLEALAHDLGIAADARALLDVVDRDEFAPQGLDLVSDLGARVVGAHDGPQARRRPDGREAGDAGADDEHLRGRNLAGGGDLTGEEAAELVRSLDDRAVAADVGHRRQCVELLRARHARHAVHREDGAFLGGELFQQLGILRRPDEADERHPLADQVHLVGGRCAHLEDDVGARPEARRIRHDRRAGRPVGVVADGGAVAGSGLHDDREAELAQLLDHVGYRGDALFAREYLLRNPDDLRHVLGFPSI